MDVKAPLKKYQKIVKTKCNLDTIKESIENIKSSKIPYEFRTTISKSFLSLDDIINIGKTIKNAQNYFLQNFKSVKILDPNFVDSRSYSNADLQLIKNKLLGLVSAVSIR
jgi:pyruvate formate lyase activating enzyme